MTSRNTGRVRTKPIKAAEWPVVAAFQDLQHAWLLQENPSDDLCPVAVKQFERASWDRLLRYLMSRPLPRD